MINYNHLYYFWVVAKMESLSRAAQSLNLSQPAVSLQIKAFEENLGVPLFERKNRRLILTREGKSIFAKADDMFHVSSQIESMIENKDFLIKRRALSIGTRSSLSKNFQFFFLKSLFQHHKFRATIHAGDMESLFRRMDMFELDIILTNDSPTDIPEEYLIKKVTAYPMCIVGLADHVKKSPSLKELLEQNDVFVPTRINRARIDFDTYIDQKGIEPRIIAEVDSTALLRLFATSGLGVAVISKMGIMRDLAQGDFHILYELPSVQESFYLIAKHRIFEDYDLAPILSELRGELNP